jgi:hypothetical protein
MQSILVSISWYPYFESKEIGLLFWGIRFSRRRVWSLESALVSYSLIGVDRRFRGSYYLHQGDNLSRLWRRQYSPLKRRSTPMRLHTTWRYMPEDPKLLAYFFPIFAELIMYRYILLHVLSPSSIVLLPIVVFSHCYFDSAPRDLLFTTNFASEVLHNFSYLMACEGTQVTTDNSFMKYTLCRLLLKHVLYTSTRNNSTI